MSSQDSTPLLHRPYLVPLRKRPWYKDKMFYFNLIRRGLAEFLGTGLFIFTSVSALSNVGHASESRDYNDGANSLAIPAGLAQGLAYGTLVAAMMHVSGGHLNPAVTVGVLVAGGVNIVAAIVYFFAQLVGGIVGAACVLAYDTSDGTALEYGVTQLQGHISPGQGIFIELLLTMLLVMVFIHSTMEKSEYRAAAPVIIGLALTAAIVSSYPLTGGSMNPVRSFGPAVISHYSHRWTNHYVYWIGPLFGGVTAGLFYRLILSSKPLIPITEPDTIHRTV